MTINPNAPVIDYAIAWAATPRVDPATVTAWTAVLNRTQGTVTTQRGRQYETDTVEPGELTVVLDNRDAALDPTNGASPFAGSVVPYRLFRMRAQYPPTVNALTQAQQAASPSIALAANQARTAIPSASWNGWSCQPGATYSVSVHVSATAASSRLFLNLSWFDVNGALIGTSSSAALTVTVADSQQSFTATAPTNACSAVFSCDAQNVNATPKTLTVSKAQVEIGPAASASVAPGVWYSIFTGYVERFPQTWQANGMRGECSPTVVDVLGWLSGQKLWPAYIADLLSFSPNFLYPLWEEDLASSGGIDITGKRQAAPVVFGSAGPSIGGVTGGGGDSVTPGTDFASGTVDNAPGQFLGSPMSTAEFANTPLVSGVSGPASFIDIGIAARAAGISPGPPTTGPWSRLIAFKFDTDNGGGEWIDDAHTAFTEMVLWQWRTPSYFASTQQASYEILFGYPNLIFVAKQAASTTTTTLLHNGAASLNDGNWHLLILTMAADLQTMHASVDGKGWQTFSLAWASVFDVTPNGSDVIGAEVDPATRTTTRPFAGNIGLVAELPIDLFGATITDTNSTHTAYLALNQGWRNGYGALGDPLAVGVPYGGSDTSGARYQRIARWSGFGGAVVTDIGETVTYGPAVEFNNSDRSSNPDASSALQSVVDTEGGYHFAGAGGDLHFVSRQYRTLTIPVVCVFGENAAGGEIPYLGDVEFDFDPDHLANDVEIDQAFQGSTFTSTAPASSLAYGDRTTSRTVNTNDALEAAAAAQAVVYTEAVPTMRVASITVDASVNPTKYPTLLGLSIGARVQVRRRPGAGAATITFDGWIEAIAWSVNGDTGQITVTFQISPVLKIVAGMTVPDTFATSGAVTAGVTSILMAALPDALTNPPRANIPYGDGLNWLLEVAGGASTFEPVQIDGVEDVGVTGTAFHITLRNPTAHAYPAGAVITQSSANYSAYLPGSIADTAVASY